MVFNTTAALLDGIVLAVVAKEEDGTYGYKITHEVKNIIDIVENLHVEGQVKFFFKLKDKVFDYLCQFTKKEADYIIYYYNKLKNNDYIDPALYAAYLGTQ